MANNKLDKFKALVSDEKSEWLKKAKWRQENQDWLDISYGISVKILSVLRANKKTGAFPKNQKELATAMRCTPQYVNKLLKGAEKLNIETISKIQKTLKITIINGNFGSKKTEIVVQKEDTAFEIFEHILSPYVVLKKIKATKLITTIPLNLWFAKAYRSNTDKWDRHYHEFEDWQFDWLLEKTGWVDKKNTKWTSPINKIGFRPILRIFTPRYYVVYAERESKL